MAANCLEGIPLDQCIELYEGFKKYPFHRTIKYSPKKTGQSRVIFKPHELRTAFKKLHYAIIELIFNADSLQTSSFGLTGDLPE